MHTHLAMLSGCLLILHQDFSGLALCLGHHSRAWRVSCAYAEPPPPPRMSRTSPLSLSLSIDFLPSHSPSGSPSPPVLLLRAGPRRSVVACDWVLALAWAAVFFAADPVCLAQQAPLACSVDARLPPHRPWAWTKLWHAPAGQQDAGVWPGLTRKASGRRCSTGSPGPVSARHVRCPGVLRAACCGLPVGASAGGRHALLRARRGTQRKSRSMVSGP